MMASYGLDVEAVNKMVNMAFAATTGLLFEDKKGLI